MRHKDVPRRKPIFMERNAQKRIKGGAWMKSSPTPVWEDNNLERNLQSVLNFTRPTILGGCAVVRIAIERANYVTRADWQTEARGVLVRYVRRVANIALQIQPVVHTNEALGVAEELGSIEQVVEFHAELHSDSLGQL